MITSIKYCWAIWSLQLMICSVILGSTVWHNSVSVSFSNSHNCTHLLVRVDIYALQLAETGKILAHQQTEFLALLLSPHFVPHRPLVLHPDPQLVHLREILKDKMHRILDPASLARERSQNQ